MRRNLLRSGLFKRFILVMAGLALVPAVIMGFQLVSISHTAIQASVLELHTKVAEKKAEETAIYIKNIDDKVRFMLLAMQRQGMDWNTRQELMRTLIESHADIESISVLAEGQERLRLASTSFPAQKGVMSYAQDPGYVRFARERTRTLWVSKRPTGVPRLEIYYALGEKADLRVSVILNTLSTSISEERISGTGYAMLVGSGGIPLIYPPGKLSEKEKTSIIDWTIVQSALTAPAVGSGDREDSEGKVQVGAYAPVSEISAAVVTQQPKDEAYAAAIKMKRTAGIIVLLICVGAIIVAFTMARRLTLPLLALAQGAEKVSLSRGEFPEEVAIRTNDELQHFAETFNRMVSRLKGYSEIQADRRIEEQMKTEAMLFSIDDGVLVIDDEKVVQLTNRVAVEILEKKEGLEGKKLSEILREDSELGSAVMEVADHPSERVVKEVDLSTEERRLFVRINAYRLIAPAKKTEIGVVIVLHDVTLEKELDKMKEEFLHSITHDLRNPLGSITGFLEIMRKGVVGELNAQQKGMVESMLKSANRLMTLVNNILDVAKMEDTTKIEINLKESPVKTLASRSLEILEALAQRRGIRLEVHSEEEFNMPVDPTQIERVITNLVGNAIKFAPDDGFVKVHLKDKGTHVECCVEDNGPGIPASHLDKIFGKFEQVPGQKQGGTGLGLTICKRFVEAHKGRIWVESEQGSGARFYFTIPKSLTTDEKGEVLVGAVSDAKKA